MSNVIPDAQPRHPAPGRNAELEQKIRNLQNHIDSRRASLPYLDRGYFEEQEKINVLERQLQAFKAQRA